MDHSDPLRTLFADDMVFHQPGRNPTSGDDQGLDAVVGLLRTLGERSGGTFRSQVHDLLATDQHAVALLRVTAQRGAITVDVPGSMSGTCATASSPRPGPTRLTTTFWTSSGPSHADERLVRRPRPYRSTLRADGSCWRRDRHSCRGCA
jgi:hypothetical protein